MSKFSSKPKAPVLIGGKKVTSDKVIVAKALNDEQKLVLKTFYDNQISMVSGPAGCGKTYLAVTFALQEFYRGHYQQIVFVRPQTESGPSLGFLPGSFYEKVAPLMIPMFSIMGQVLTPKDINDLLVEEKLIMLPFAYLRGITFDNAIVVADECSNASNHLIRLLLTRIGKNSKILMTGDPLQSDFDLKNNGFLDALSRFKNMENIGIVNMTKEAIVRHPLIAEIERRYEKN